MVLSAIYRNVWWKTTALSGYSASSKSKRHMETRSDGEKSVVQNVKDQGNSP